MAKRSSRRPARTAKAPKARRAKGSPLVKSAQDFILAEQRYRDAEAAFHAARRDLDTLRAALTRHIGAQADAGFAAPAAPAPGKGRRGPKAGGAPRPGTLGDRILAHLASGGEHGPTEVFDALAKEGFKSKGTEKSQRVMVSQTLSRLAARGLVRKVGRGTYTKA
jgi:hypothetical protein